MTTFVQLVNQVHSLLHSYCGTQEQITALTASVDASVTSFSVTSGAAFSRGLIEIEDELIETDASDTSSIAAFPFGRGARGTTAAAHSSGVKVTYKPAFPRFEIKRAINQCIDQIYPQLYSVKSTTFTSVGSQATYPLPTDCDKPLKVIWETTGPSLYWQTVASWEFETNSQVANGNALTFHEYVQPGRTVKVVYIAKPSQFSADADTFAAKGIEESWLDVLLYGAAAKLVRFMDPARLSLNSVENLSRAQVVGVGDAGKVANQLYAMYQQRLNEERRRLLDLNPPQIHFTR